MTTQVVKVKKELLVACITCPLCDKLLKEATTISECLHTFCRKCIYDKLTEEEIDCCPICNIDLGCSPLEKLRPDHNLQDVRAKIFPLKRRKVKTPEVVTPVALPVRRKERSLSSLVVSTPRVSTQSGLTGRRTKAVARRAATLKNSGFAINGSIKKEEDTGDDRPESSSSPEYQNKIPQNKRQNSSTGEPSNHTSNRESDNGGESWPPKVDLWKPLNCLVEAANRTKSFKSNSYVKSEQSHCPENAKHSHKSKKEHKSKLQNGNNGGLPASSGLMKARKLRKKAAASRALTSPQALLNAIGVQHERRTSAIWCSLVASDHQEGDAPLPQISSSYLRIKDGDLPVSYIQKYLTKKLDLTSETEVELSCQGERLVPSMPLHTVIELWLRASTSQRVAAAVGTAAKEFVMVLSYSLKSPVP
ncbi:E3 ubiquitin protein ligase DRIP2-like [Aristolochia californica]|uniref:E3 ubiquitin protein ligase DRIP2-like n=1 Tax=Aristolochia californica TaxID=171875 RepID=UPI0035E328F2